MSFCSTLCDGVASFSDWICRCQPRPIEEIYSAEERGLLILPQQYDRLVCTGKILRLFGTVITVASAAVGLHNYTYSVETDSAATPCLIIGISLMIFGCCMATSKHRAMIEVTERDEERESYGSMGMDGAGV